MSGKRQPDLTEGQKACLRLVNEHRTSKEIARILDISPFTVDQRLDAARKKLNASSRAEAARFFALSEERRISDPMVYEAAGVAAAASAVIPAMPPGKGGQADMTRRLAGFGQEQSAIIDRKTPLYRLFSHLPVPPLGGQRHEFSKREILFQSLNVAFFSVLIMAAIVLVLSGALRLLR